MCDPVYSIYNSFFWVRTQSFTKGSIFMLTIVWQKNFFECVFFQLFFSRSKFFFFFISYCVAGNMALTKLIWRCCSTWTCNCKWICRIFFYRDLLIRLLWISFKLIQAEKPLKLMVPNYSRFHIYSALKIFVVSLFVAPIKWNGRFEWSRKNKTIE